LVTYLGIIGQLEYHLCDVIIQIVTVIKIKNSNGPSTDPCSMPLNTSAQRELLPCIQTLCFLPLSYDATHLTTWLSIPWDCRCDV